MFYSHEILTSREHGAATVWLVATLGSKSTASKVNRKAILDVDVAKACGMIVRPEAPMALRLQGNLLYGVTKVYSQQCGYTLMDAQNVKDRMTTMLKTIRSAGLDPEAGRARPDQLVLPQDPTFIPELMLPGLNVDLSCLEIANFETPNSGFLSSCVPRSNKSGRLASHQLRLDLSSEIGNGQFGFPSEMSSPKKGPEVELPAFLGEEAGVLLQPDFEFDEEGNIRELPVTTLVADGGMATEQRQAAEVRDTIDPNVLGGQEQFEGQIPIDEDIVMRDVGDELSLGNELNPEPDTQAPDDELLSGTPAVQMRQRKRNIKAIDFDNPAELRNSDLAQWNVDYTRNMTIAAKLKQNNRIITVAKKNAAFWVLGAGIASVGVNIGICGIPHPLEAFFGEQLLGALTGNPLKTPRRKRKRDAADGPDEEEAGRTIRQRVDGEDELGREAGEDLDDAPGFLYDDIEVGREAAPSLHDDHSSQMPWNITASIQSSRHGSALRGRQAQASAGRYSSIGRQLSVTSGQDGTAMGKRRGRLTSASPLAGRGAMRSPLDAALASDRDIDLTSLNGLDLGDYLNEDSHADDDAHAHAHASKKTQPKWLSSNLDQESVNFLTFVKTRLDDDNDDGEEETGRTDVSFSALFPHESISPVVATQAFLHVLTLATSNALRVHQGNVVDANGAQEVGDIRIALSG